ncbi:MAG: hypothetical protein QOJ15_3174 [Bradyrhizobium sp.]|jgi:hypothetical protein|nr:hypothetical protein [Bradyrhizobium sp.]
MPDTLATFESNSIPSSRADGLHRASGQSDNWTPRTFVARVISVTRPLLNDDGSLRQGVDTAQIVKALEPLMGRYTVEDAVLAADLMEVAQEIASDIENSALASVWFTLRDFICSAEGSSSACAVARAIFVGNERVGFSPECRSTIIEALRWDVLNRESGNWGGNLFGGRDANEDSVFEEQPWWEHRATILNRAN